MRFVGQAAGLYDENNTNHESDIHSRDFHMTHMTMHNACPTMFPPSLPPDCTYIIIITPPVILLSLSYGDTPSLITQPSQVILVAVKSRTPHAFNIEAVDKR